MRVRKGRCYVGWKGKRCYVGQEGRKLGQQGMEGSAMQARRKGRAMWARLEIMEMLCGPGGKERRG